MFSLRVFYNLLTVLRGCFTPIGRIHLSLLLFSTFLSFFSFLSPFFTFFPPFSSFSLSLSLPADFWCGDRRHAAPLPTGLITLSVLCRIKKLAWSSNTSKDAEYKWAQNCCRGSPRLMACYSWTFDQDTGGQGFESQTELGIFEWRIRIDLYSF